MAEKFTINDSELDIEYKKEKDLIVKGVSKSKDTPSFHVCYPKDVKNLVFSMHFAAKKTSAENEIFFYMRYRDKDTHCCFSLRSGKEIRFYIKSAGKYTIDTTYIPITSGSLLNEKFDFIISAFEDTFTVLIDRTIVINLDHMPEDSGKFGMDFVSLNDDEFNLYLEDFSLSDEILNFEPILDIPKNPDAYFMIANIFYEQNNYDLAIYYYRRGLHYGRGDCKVFNRMGNLLYIFEEYESAEKYYRAAGKEDPVNVEYKVNLCRSLIKQNKSDEFKIMVDDFAADGIVDKELFIDYAGYLIDNKKYETALEYLGKIESECKESPDFESKMGRCLTEMGDLVRGQKYLLEASRLYYDKNPAMSIIILRYSINKRGDFNTFKLLAKILRENEEYNEIYNVLKPARLEVEFDEELNDTLFESELKLDLFSFVEDDYKRIDDSQKNGILKVRLAEAYIGLGRFEDADAVFKDIFANKNLMETHSNLIVKDFIVLVSKRDQGQDLQGVIKHLNKSQPGYYEALSEYGKLLVDRRYCEAAIPILEEILAVDKDNIEIRYNLGIAYDGVGEYFKAMDHLQSVYNETDNPEVVYLLAHSMFYAKYIMDALSLLMKNYERIPQDGKADNLMGNIHLSLGNVTDAQKYYYKALDCDGENEEYALNLAESFYKMKDYENAYKITSQLVKPGELDRAKTMHIRVKDQLFETLKCAKCKREWSFHKKEVAPDVNIKEVFNKLPPAAPSGLCPKCNTVYCKSCVPADKNGDCFCPECGSKLSYDYPGLNIIAASHLTETEKITTKRNIIEDFL